VSAVKDEVTALSWSPDGKQLLTYRGHGAEVTALSRCKCDYSMA